MGLLSLRKVPGAVSRLLNVVLLAHIALALVFFSEAGAETPRMLDPAVVPDKPSLSGLPRMRFLTSLDFPPFNFSDETQRPIGFNVELARTICRVLEIEEKCEIQAMPWDELQGALAARRGEAIIAGTAVTGENRRLYGLTRPYFRFPARFIAPKSETPQEIVFDMEETSPLAGKRVIVVQATAHAAMLNEYFPDAELRPYPDQQAAYAALRDGEGDYMFGDGVALGYYLTSAAAAQCCVFVSGPYFDAHFLGHGMAIATRPEDTVLLQAFDYALAIIERDGLHDELLARYFPLSPYSPSGSGP